ILTRLAKDKHRREAQDWFGMNTTQSSYGQELAEIAKNRKWRESLDDSSVKESQPGPEQFCRNPDRRGRWITGRTRQTSYSSALTNITGRSWAGMGTLWSRRRISTGLRRAALALITPSVSVRV